jgi:hypothetical protein
MYSILVHQYQFLSFPPFVGASGSILPSSLWNHPNMINLVGNLNLIPHVTSDRMDLAYPGAGQYHEGEGEASEASILTDLSLHVPTHGTSCKFASQDQYAIFSSLMSHTLSPTPTPVCHPGSSS